MVFFKIREIVLVNVMLYRLRWVGLFSVIVSIIFIVFNSRVMIVGVFCLLKVVYI